MAVIVPIVSKFDDKGIKQAQSQFGQLGSSMKKALGAAAIAAAVVGVTKVLGDAAKAAATDAKSQALLATQLRTTTAASDSQISAVEAQISKMSILAGVADDEIRPAFSQLVRATGDVGKAQALTNTALDIAAAKGVSVTAAATALGKAAQGNTSALSKMGVAVKGVADPLAEAQKQFAGAAEAAGNANPFQRLTIVFDELKESLGRTVLPLVQAFSDLMVKNAPAIDAFFGKLGEVFQSLMPVVGPLFEIVGKLASMIGDVLLAVMPSLIKVFEALLPVIDPVLSVIKTLVDAVLPPLIQLIDQVLVPVLELLVGYINNFLVPYIDELAKSLGVVLTEAVIAVIEIFDLLRDAFEPLMQMFEDLQKDTGIDFMALFKSLSPALLLLKSLSMSLAQITFAIKMARAAATGNWAEVARLTAEGPFAAMKARAEEADKAAKAADAAANSKRGADAYASRYAGMEAAGQALGYGVKVDPNYVAGPPVKTDGKAEKAAKAAADKAAKARQAIIDAAQKASEEAKKAFDDLKASVENFNTAFGQTVDAFKNVFKQTQPLGDFEAQTVEAFDTIKQSAKDAFDSKLITKGALASLEAYAAREQTLLQGIAKQRDVLAKKISIAETVTAGVMGSLDINSMLSAETKTVSKSVTSIVNGIALTTTQSFDEVVTGGLAASFKKLVDKTKTFAGNLTKLKQLGLNGNLFKQIVEGGADAGGATAEAIIAGGADAVKELNGLFTELTDAGADIAKTSTPVLYDLGENMTNSFIDGLRSQDQVLIDTANSMAALFTEQFKSQLNLAIAPTVATAESTAMSAQMAVDLTSRPDPKRSPQSYANWLSSIGGIDPVRSPESYAKAQANTYNVTINAGAITDQASLPTIVTNALVTATKQGLTGGLSRLLAV